MKIFSCSSVDWLSFQLLSHNFLLHSNLWAIVFFFLATNTSFLEGIWALATSKLTSGGIWNESNENVANRDLSWFVISFIYEKLTSWIFAKKRNVIVSLREPPKEFTSSPSWGSWFGIFGVPENLPVSAVLNVKENTKSSMLRPPRDHKIYHHLATIRSPDFGWWKGHKVFVVSATKKVTLFHVSASIYQATGYA